MRAEPQIHKNIILLAVSKQDKFLFGTQYIYKYKSGLNIKNNSADTIKGVDVIVIRMTH